MTVRTATVNVRAGDGSTTTRTVRITEAPQAKPRTLGMRDRGGRPHPAGASVAVHVPISAIAPDHRTLNMDPLKVAIAAAKKAGAGACTIALDGGTQESDDAKAFFGSVSLVDPQGTRPNHVTVLFSTPAYQARAEEIIAATAAVVDPDPFCREYGLWHNGAEFSMEWPIREGSNATNRAAWLGTKGYDPDADAAYCVAAPAMYARHFTTTRIYTWMPMGFQRMSAAGVKQDMSVNRAFLDQFLKWCPTGVLGVDNADLKSYGPGRPAIYELALEYARKGLARFDQTVTAAKMPGAAAVQQFFSEPNLRLMAADLVYGMEYPVGSGMTEAQFQAAHDYLTNAAGGTS